LNKAILFVHGLGGDRTTWGNFKNLIDEDERLEYASYFYEYPTGIIRLPLIQQEYGTMHELSDGLSTYIDVVLKSYDEIVLVGHSLGGLIIRHYLLNQKNNRAFNPNLIHQTTKIKKVIFYAVPQDGSNLAKVNSLISWKHPHLKQLCKNSRFLMKLNQEWEEAQMNHEYLFEIVMAGEDGIVDEASVTANFRHIEPKIASYKGHITVVKPRDRNDFSFRILRDFLLPRVPMPQYASLRHLFLPRINHRKLIVS
jgi:pimeloyl-ACP methyl ester carboxylesterase